MSHCEDTSGCGRHRAIFLTREDADPRTSKETEPEEHPDDAPPGLILPDGSINWNCPCLGGMPSGPCGVEFRSAFECFHNSESDTKGSDCLEKFMEMQDCFRQHPELYAEDVDPTAEMKGEEDGSAMAKGKAEDAAPSPQAEAGGGDAKASSQ